MAIAAGLVYRRAATMKGVRMRSVTALLATTLLIGCAKDVKPTGPVLTPFERARDFSKPGVSGATYSSQPPLSEAVVPPFMAFGSVFDLDIALGLKKHRLDMIEVARMQTPDGPLWVVLESAAGTGEQTLYANLEEVQTWMPELPIARKGGGLQVQDRTTSDGIDLTVKYTNSDNQPVEIVLQGQPPSKGASKRNGNTMGHGDAALLAVLDVSASESLFKADVRINDERVGMRKLGGIVPFQFTLVQAMGGLAIGEYTVEPGEKKMPFEKNDAWQKGYVWTPPPPEPEPEPFPEPRNVPGDDGPLLLPQAQWVAVPADKAKAAIAAQPAQVDACSVAALATDPEFKGIVQVDFFVKAKDAWTITAHPDSTAPNLTIKCVQEIVDSWAFDEKLEGGMSVTLARFPDGHVGANALETAWLTAEAARKAEEAKKAGKKPEAPKPEPVVDLLGEDLLGEPVKEAVVPKSKFAQLSWFETLHRAPNGDTIGQGWKVRRDGGRVFVSQDAGVRTLTYEYIVNGQALELRSVQAHAWGQSAPAFAVTFTPPLPDLRIPFSGKVRSNFVMDVGGQQSHATGTVESSFADTGSKVVITPTAPSWAESRPITSQIGFGDGKATVRTRRGL